MDQLTKLYIEVTTICNLDCQMCVRRAWQEPYGHMPLATFDKLMNEVSSFSPRPTIHLSGFGEPMAHPNFLELVQRAKATGARVEVTTNGTLLTKDMAVALVDLDLNRLVVSIDGTTPDSYDDIRQGSSLKQVIANMRYLRQLKLRRGGRHSNPQVGIAFVAMKQNMAELKGLPWLATYLGSWEIQVSNLIPHMAPMESEILYERALTACAFRSSRWVANMSLPKFDLDEHTLPPLGQVFGSTTSLSLLDASMSGRNDYCRFAQEGYAVVRWDGQVSPCLSLLHDHPEYIRGRRKDVTHYALGNINSQSLDELWPAPEFADFRASRRAFRFSPCSTCGGCDRFAANFTDCTDNGFPTCGGCLWAQGFIQCP